MELFTKKMRKHKEERKMELVNVTNGQIEIQQEALSKLKSFQEYKKEMDKLEKDIKKNILEAMEKNGIKSFENDVVKILYVEPYTRTTIDTKLVNELGLMHQLSKGAQVKSSVKVTWK